ncbi:MAG: hypothetical protein ACTHOK_03505 [Nocardioidaceae bacterium]
MRTNEAARYAAALGVLGQRIAGVSAAIQTEQNEARRLELCALRDDLADQQEALKPGDRVGVARLLAESAVDAGVGRPFTARA